MKGGGAHGVGSREDTIEPTGRVIEVARPD